VTVLLKSPDSVPDLTLTKRKYLLYLHINNLKGLFIDFSKHTFFKENWYFYDFLIIAFPIPDPDPDPDPPH
jgi:hypothetical protein